MVRFHQQAVAALLLPLLFGSAQSFLLTPSKKIIPTTTKNVLPVQQEQPQLSFRLAVVQKSSSSDDEGSNEIESSKPSRRRKRRRKTTTKATEDEPEITTEAAAEAQEEIDEPPTIELKPRQQSGVKVQVRDIRDVVNQGSSSSVSGGSVSSVTPASTTSPTTVNTVSASEPLPSASSGGESPSLSSFEQLLIDAREMQQSDSTSSDGGGDFKQDDIMMQRGVLLEKDEEEKEFSIPETIGKVMSTIVTVDFFVVCGFLVWFLVGIVSSSIFKDDTIQIAFNNNFELLVQPALGILMIASIASSFFKEDEYDEEVAPEDLDSFGRPRRE